MLTSSISNLYHEIDRALQKAIFSGFQNWVIFQSDCLIINMSYKMIQINVCFVPIDVNCYLILQPDTISNYVHMYNISKVKKNCRCPNECGMLDCNGIKYYIM